MKPDKQPAYRLNHPSTRNLNNPAPPEPATPASVTIISTADLVEIELRDETTRQRVVTIRIAPAALVAALARYAHQPAEYLLPPPTTKTA